MAGSRKIVAIHQPNFFPCLGYFNKIALADVFVILDSVQFQKTGGTWSNRVKLRVRGEPAWVTAPVDRGYHGLRTVAEMCFAAGDWRQKVLRIVRDSYGATTHFKEIDALLAPLIERQTDRLADYNLHAIRTLCRAVGLDTSRLVSSSAMKADGKATDLLVAIVREVGGTTYLAGGGASGYQQDEIFCAAGIDVVYQEFKHPEYAQAAAPSFAPGLSIIDALMNVGVDATATLLRSSRPAALTGAGN